MNQQDNDTNDARNTLAIVVLGFAVGFFWPSCESKADMRELSEKTRLAQDCPKYDPDLYPYPASIEPEIVRAQGGLFLPYTGKKLYSIKQSDIEHLVARHIAHERGLCHATPEVRKAFATDLLNLTLALPNENRHIKSDKPPAEYMPPHNRCWYAARWLAVSLKYDLRLPDADRAALKLAVSNCDSLDIIR